MNMVILVMLRRDRADGTWRMPKEIYAQPPPLVFTKIVATIQNKIIKTTIKKFIPRAAKREVRTSFICDSQLCKSRFDGANRPSWAS